MGKKIKAGTKGDEPELRFDEASRREFVLGFRKRKELRRKKARREELEKARQEKIDVQREHREDIKKRWKDVLWAERTVDRVLDKRAAMLKDRQLALENGEMAPALKADGESSSSEEELDDFDGGGDGWMPPLEDLGIPRGDEVTVSFERIEDDPFGDCEVTTTAVSVLGPTCDSGLTSRPSSTALALQGEEEEESRLQLARCGPDGKPMTAEELEEHRRRRAVALRKEETRRRAAQDKRIKKHAQELKKMKKKSTKHKVKKGQKAGAKARRRRKGGAK